MKTILHTATHDPAKRLDFYTRLGYTVVSAENPTLVSDGQCIIEINPDRSARPGVKLYADSWADAVAKLEPLTAVRKLETGGYLLGDPSGVWIYLVEGAPPAVDISGIQPSTLGKFAGLTLETTDPTRSVKIWETLGFKAVDLGGWVIYQAEDGAGVSFMPPGDCPHLFFNPSVSYFNGKDNLAIIQKVRDSGIPIAEEITHFNKEGIVDNIILRDPAGFGFFVYSD